MSADMLPVAMLMLIAIAIGVLAFVYDLCRSLSIAASTDKSAGQAVERQLLYAQIAVLTILIITALHFDV